ACAQRHADRKEPSQALVSSATLFTEQYKRTDQQPQDAEADVKGQQNIEQVFHGRSLVKVRASILLHGRLRICVHQDLGGRKLDTLALKCLEQSLAQLAGQFPLLLRGGLAHHLDDHGRRRDLVDAEELRRLEK